MLASTRKQNTPLKEKRISYVVETPTMFKKKFSDDAMTLEAICDGKKKNDVDVYTKNFNNKKKNENVDFDTHSTKNGNCKKSSKIRAKITEVGVVKVRITEPNVQITKMSNLNADAKPFDFHGMREMKAGTNCNVKLNASANPFEFNNRKLNAKAKPFLVPMKSPTTTSNNIDMSRSSSSFDAHTARILDRMVCDSSSEIEFVETISMSEIMERRHRIPRIHMPKQSNRIPNFGRNILSLKKNDTNYKTEMCIHFGHSGFCRFGASCKFAHGRSDMRVRKSAAALNLRSFKTVQCRKWAKNGMCPYGDMCTFLHGDEDPMRDNMERQLLENSGPIPNVMLTPEERRCREILKIQHKMSNRRSSGTTSFMGPIQKGHGSYFLSEPPSHAKKEAATPTFGIDIAKMNPWSLKVLNKRVNEMVREFDSLNDLKNSSPEDIEMLLDSLVLWDDGLADGPAIDLPPAYKKKSPPPACNGINTLRLRQD